MKMRFLHRCICRRYVDVPDALQQRSSKWSQAMPPAGVIALGLGQPPASLLPLDLLRDSFSDLFTNCATDPLLLQYHRPLASEHDRSSFAAYTSIASSFHIPAECVGLTAGVSVSLATLASVLYIPGAVALVERPCYFLAPAILRSAGFTVVDVPTDPEGLRTRVLARALHLHRAEGNTITPPAEPAWPMLATPSDADVGSNPLPLPLDEATARRLAARLRGHHPRLLYTVPVHNNPTGATLPADRRIELLAACRASGVAVAADEVYHLLTYSHDSAAADDCDTAVGASAHSRHTQPERSDGTDTTSSTATAASSSTSTSAMYPSRLPAPPHPPLPMCDTGAAAVSISSVSKTFAPGVRVGTVIAHVSALRAMGAAAVHASGGHVNPMGAAAMACAVRSGAFHAARVRYVHENSRRLAAMMRALGAVRTSVPGIHVSGGWDETGVGKTRATEYMGHSAAQRPVSGGYFVWVTLPASIDATAAAAEMLASARVGVHAGPLFEPCVAPVADPSPLAQAGSDNVASRGGADSESFAALWLRSVGVEGSPVASRLASSVRLCFAFYDCDAIAAAVEAAFGLLPRAAPAAFAGPSTAVEVVVLRAMVAHDGVPLGATSGTGGVAAGGASTQDDSDKCAGARSTSLRVWMDDVGDAERRALRVRCIVLCNATTASRPQRTALSLGVESCSFPFPDGERVRQGDDVVSIVVAWPRGAPAAQRYGLAVRVSRCGDAATAAAITVTADGGGVGVVRASGDGERRDELVSACCATHPAATDTPAHWVLDFVLRVEDGNDQTWSGAAGCEVFVL